MRLDSFIQPNFPDTTYRTDFNLSSFNRLSQRARAIQNLAVEKIPFHQMQPSHRLSYYKLNPGVHLPLPHKVLSPEAFLYRNDNNESTSPHLDYLDHILKFREFYLANSVALAFRNALNETIRNHQYPLLLSILSDFYQLRPSLEVEANASLGEGLLTQYKQHMTYINSISDKA